MSLLALDTSVAVRLLMQAHPGHEAANAWQSGRAVVLSGHAAVETYSVLTRFPGDARLSARDAVRLMEGRFGRAITLTAERTAALPAILAELGVWGGAVYDALVGLTAADHGAELATCDRRASSTYQAVGATVVQVPPG